MVNDFLITLFSPQQPRRNRVIFGLLKNQTTVSTLYWGLRYQLLDYIGLLAKLTLPEFEAILAQYEKDEMVVIDTEGQVLLTSKGLEVQEHYLQEHVKLEDPHEFSQINAENWQAGFLLANQIVSERAYQNKQYYPLQVGPQLMFLVRRWYYQVRQPQLTAQWVQEVRDFLVDLPTMQANKFVATWIGHYEAGAVQEQLELPTSWDQFDFMLWQLNYYVAWSRKIRELPVDSSKPIRELWQLVAIKALLPGPVVQTLQAVENNLSIEQIANYRKLKISTIREHLLVAAIMLDKAKFPYERFLNVPIVTYLQTKLQGNIDNWQFKQVRQSADPMEFFYFRLYTILKTKEAVTEDAQD